MSLQERVSAVVAVIGAEIKGLWEEKADVAHDHDGEYHPSNWAPSVADIPAGSMLAVHHNGTAWPPRPTSRTNVHVHWIGSTQADPPPGAIPGDLHDYIATP